MSSLDYDQIPVWRSLDELADDPEFLERLKDEFPNHEEDLEDPLSRRRFMQLMGASMAMAGVVSSGCRRWEKDKIVPRGEARLIQANRLPIVLLRVGEPVLLPVELSTELERRRDLRILCVNQGLDPRAQFLSEMNQSSL